MPDPTIDERDIEARIGECDRLMEHEDGVDAPGFAITMMLNYSHIRNAYREQQKVNARLRRFVHGGGRKTMVCVPARTNRRRAAGEPEKLIIKDIITNICWTVAVLGFMWMVARRI